MTIVRPRPRPRPRPPVPVRRLVALTLLVGLAGTLTLVGMPPPPAQAQTGECSLLDPVGTECIITDLPVPRPPPPGERQVVTSAPPGPRFVWLNLLIACDAAESTGWTPNDDLDTTILDLTFLAGASPPEEPGVLWIGELVHPATGPTNTGFVSCVAAGQPRPPLPPPLPTAGEIWGAALTFTPSVNLDPYVRGLTGLDTYLWYEGPEADSVSLTLNGYAVTAQIQAVEFRWDTGAESRDGVSHYVSVTPGSPDAPAATHVYATPAEVVVTHEVVWTGSAALTGPGIPAGGVTVDLGQAVVTVSRSYEVIEVRTPLVPPAGTSTE